METVGVAKSTVYRSRDRGAEATVEEYVDGTAYVAIARFSGPDPRAWDVTAEHDFDTVEAAHLFAQMGLDVGPEAGEVQ